MEIASYRDNPPEQQRSRSPARLYSPTTTTPLSFRSNEVDTERKLGTGVDNRVKQKERPKRIIGDGNIYGHSSTTSYADRDNHISSSSNHDDDDQEIEAALALALPTSPITDAVPLREAANVPVDTRDGNNGRSLLRENINPFQTGLGLRHNWEACAAYVMLPPVGSVGLLLLEQQSDYVRFHAWQSGLLFTMVFIAHIFLSGSAVLSWTFLFCDVVLINWLAYRAHKDAKELVRYKIPVFGPLASSIVDDE